MNEEINIYLKPEDLRIVQLLWENGAGSDAVSFHAHFMHYAVYKLQTDTRAGGSRADVTRVAGKTSWYVVPSIILLRHVEGREIN